MKALDKMCSGCKKVILTHPKAMYCSEECRLYGTFQYSSETQEEFWERRKQIKEKQESMKKREAQFQTIFNQYIREKGFHGYFELKNTTTDKFFFSKVEKHQIDSLLAAQNSGLVWKFSDQDQRQKPFDSISSPPLDSFVVIKFPECFCMILVNDFLHKKETNDRKHITLQEAKDIAKHKCMY